jgi:spore germination cell wall hydrolase CwlJ-like protein
MAFNPRAQYEHQGITPEDVARRRAYAKALLEQSLQYEPIYHPLGAVAKAVQGFVGGAEEARAGKAETEGLASGSMDKVLAVPEVQRSWGAGTPSPKPAAPDIEPDAPVASTKPITQANRPLPGGGNLGPDPDELAAPTPVKASSLSPDDRDYFIRTVFGEAANQGPEGQAAVAHVINNRVRSGKYGKTAKDVVLAENQFEPWGSAEGRARMNRLSPNSPGYQRLGTMVDEIVAGKGADPTGGAEFFLNPAIVRQRRGGTLPPWAKGKETVIGDHTFYNPNQPMTVGTPTNITPPAASAANAPVQVAEHDYGGGITSDAPPSYAGRQGPSPQMQRLLANPWVSPEVKAYLLKQLEPKAPISISEGETLVDPYTYQPIPGVGGAAKSTDELREVDRINKERVANGLPPVPTEELMIRLREANRSQVNIDQRAESAFEKKYGEGLATEALETVAAADKGIATMQQADLLDRFLRDVEGGKFAGIKATFGNWAQSVGVDPASLGIDPNLTINAESAAALANRMTIGMIGPGGFPANNFSEADRKFIQQIFPQLGDTPGAQRLKAKVLRRIAELQVDRGMSWSDADAEGKSYREWSRNYRKEMRGKDVFGDIVKEYEAMKAAPVDPQKRIEEIERRLREGQ